jgi:hypothetical protein
MQTEAVKDVNVEGKIVSNAGPVLIMAVGSRLMDLTNRIPMIEPPKRWRGEDVCITQKRDY